MTKETGLYIAAIFLGTAMLTGCDNKEDILEIETPSGSIDIEKDRDTDAVDVDIKEK